MVAELEENRKLIQNWSESSETRTGGKTGSTTAAAESEVSDKFLQQNETVW